MKLWKITTLALRLIRKCGITLDALQHLLTHGHVERQFDSARFVYLDNALPRPIRDSSPRRMLYAVLDAEGEVLTVDKRVRLRG